MAATKILGGGAAPWCFPSLGPALVISMGYIDLGKWVASVESGAQFGFDLVLLLLFFNCMAILWQYLATRVGMVSEKNLAEICSEEYSRLACILLGVQAEMSLITSDLTMIMGIAYGLSLLLGVEFFSCIFLAAVCSILPPFVVNFWQDNFKAEALYISVAGVALASYVFGVLISQPEFPIVMTGFFPRLGGENAYSLMALLGSNVMAHNFYIHSAIVQRQRRPPNVPMGALFHDHFFAILFIFTGIFLVNHVLMNSAATVFSSADAKLNFQDLTLLMDQIFRSPITPIAFLLVLVLSSQITALTWNVGSKVIVRCFLGIDLPLWAHHILTKSLAVIPALYCAANGGIEGTYQLLIFCQIIQAMLLPSSAIPLFQVASSKSIMGSLRTPWYLEMLALLALFAMLASNTIFIIELLFGSSSWVMNLRANMSSYILVPRAALFTIACSSLCLSLYLAVTPLNSARIHLDACRNDWPTPINYVLAPEYNDPHSLKFDEDQEPELLLESEPPSMECQSDRSTMDVDVDISMSADLDDDSHQSIGSPSASSPRHPEKTSVVGAESGESVDEVPACASPVPQEAPIVVVRDLTERKSELQTDSPLPKVNLEGKAFPPEQLSRGILPTPVYDVSIFPNAAKGKGSNGGNSSKSLPKISGLGRAARKQFGAILDEFWGHLFDLHGNPTQDAVSTRLNVLLGLGAKSAGSSVKPEGAMDESSKVYFSEADRGSLLPENARDYSYSPRQNRDLMNFDLPYSPRIGSQQEAWPRNTQFSDAFVQSSLSNTFNLGERNRFNKPRYSNPVDYQPATIHGDQITSYLRMAAVSRSQYPSGIPIDLDATPRANLRDQSIYNSGQNASSSWGTSGYQFPAPSRFSGSQLEEPYCEPSLVGTGENVLSSAHAKKYHSSPDMSALIASIRNSSVLDRNGQWGDRIVARSSLSRLAYEQSSFLNPISSTGVPLSFDELSPTKPHGDAFSRSNCNAGMGSLWSKPFEQVFGITGSNLGGDGSVDGAGVVQNESFPCRDSITRLLKNLRFCIIKLRKLEGSDWLFKQNEGADEDLIDRLAAADGLEINREPALETRRFTDQKNGFEELIDPAYSLPLTNCSDTCIWSAALVLSFGVWCIRRLLELAVVESRPELWGKYTYVLNRLQGVLEPAFCKPRRLLRPCSCLAPPAGDSASPAIPPQSAKVTMTTAAIILDMIKDVEGALSGRKGRAGTAAGDVAFPKGKENLVSALKRYRRRLSRNSAMAACDGGSSFRRGPRASAPPSFA